MNIMQDSIPGQVTDGTRYEFQWLTLGAVYSNMADTSFEIPFFVQKMLILGHGVT